MQGGSMRCPHPVSALTALVLAALGSFGAGCGGSGGVAERVVLVTIDTLRADRVGSYGDREARTPNLDALARTGVRFDQALAPTPLTLPSHTSLMTGLEPPSHGVRHNSLFRVREELPTLAERMREAGFATAAFVGAFVLDAQFGLDRGFEVYDDDVRQRTATRTAFSFAERTADRVVDSALEWLAEAPDRFFLWVHVYDPHADYNPPARYRKALDGDAYAGEIAFADAEIGRLLQHVIHRWGREGLVVVVTSDHGESLGEHDEPSHGYTVYDATQRVPLLLAGSGVPAGAVVDAQVRLLDVAPTLLELAGADPLPEDITGRSLLPLLAGTGEGRRLAYMETLATQFDMGWSPLLALRDGAYKYIRAPRPELYDLTADPGETRNLARREPERVAELDRLLEARLADAVPVSPNLDLDAEARARLESLGYVVPDAEAGAEPEALGEVGGADPKDHMRQATHLNNAATLVSRGQPEKALEILERLPAWGPRVFRNRAGAALAANRPEVAIRAMEALREQGGARVADLTVLGMAYLGAERFEEARQVFETAGREHPDAPGPLMGLGRLAQARGDFERAAELFVRADGVSEEPGAARLDLALLRVEQGRLEEADALLATLPPDLVGRPQVVIRLAYALAEAGAPERALARLRRGVEEDPRNRQLLAAYARHLDAAGRSDEAVEIRQRVFNLDPEDPGSKNDLAWALALAGRDLDRALSLALHAVRQSDGDPVVLDTLATVHLMRREPAKALRVVARALGSDPPADVRPHLQYLRAAALAELGRREEARAALRALDAEPARLGDRWRERAAALRQRLGVEDGAPVGGDPPGGPGGAAALPRPAPGPPREPVPRGSPAARAAPHHATIRSAPSL